jgi:hypothetical protein
MLPDRRPPSAGKSRFKAVKNKQGFERACMPRRISVALMGLLLVGLAGAHGESAGTAVRIGAGEVVGKFQLNAAVRAFLGVPFARTPRRRAALEAAATGGALADRAGRDIHQRAMRAADPLENVGIL